MGNGQVVAYLHTMNVRERRDGLDLNDDTVEAYKIGYEIIVKLDATILQLKTFLTFKRNTLMLKFNGKRLLVVYFFQTRTESLVNFIDTAIYLITFIFVKYILTHHSLYYTKYAKINEIYENLLVGKVTNNSADCKAFFAFFRLFSFIS